MSKRTNVKSVEEIIELGFNCVNCAYYWEEKRHCVKVGLSFYTEHDIMREDFDERYIPQPETHLCTDGERLRPHPYQENLYSFVLRERCVHDSKSDNT